MNNTRGGLSVEGSTLISMLAARERRKFDARATIIEYWRRVSIGSAHFLTITYHLPFITSYLLPGDAAIKQINR